MQSGLYIVVSDRLAFCFFEQEIFLFAFGKHWFFISLRAHYFLYLFFLIETGLWEFRVHKALDYGSSFRYSLFIQVGRLFYLLYFASIVGETKFAGGTVSLNQQILFRNGRSSFGLRLEKFTAVLIEVERLGLVWLGGHLAINFFLLYNRVTTLGSGLALGMDLRLLSG